MNPPAIYDAFTSPTTIHVYPQALDAYLDSEWARYGTILGDLEPDAEEIKTIKRDENNKSSIYNLFGVKQSMDKKEGIYVIDGKKVLY